MILLLADAPLPLCDDVLLLSSPTPDLVLSCSLFDDMWLSAMPHHNTVVVVVGYVILSMKCCTIVLLFVVEVQRMVVMTADATAAEQARASFGQWEPKVYPRWRTNVTFQSGGGNCF